MFVARLVTCLPLCSSMLSSTPGGWLCARLYRTHHLACAILERIGTLPKSFILGAMCQIQGYFPFTSLLSFNLLSGLRLQLLRYWAAD